MLDKSLILNMLLLFLDRYILFCSVTKLIYLLIPQGQNLKDYVCLNNLFNI